MTDILPLLIEKLADASTGRPKTVENGGVT